MGRSRQIWRFVGIFFISYLALTWAHKFPAFKNVHLQVFNTLESGILNAFHSHVHVEFREFENVEGVPVEDDFDFSIYIYDKLRWRAKKSVIQPNFILNQDLRSASISPIVLLVSLIIATSISLKRKFWSLLIGTFLVYMIVALKYTYLFDQNADFLQARHSTIWQGLAAIFGKNFRTTEFLLVIVVCVWGAVTLRKSDFQKFIETR